MATAEAAQQTSLYITRRFKARCEKVYQVWTDPKALAQWFAPSDEMTTRIIDYDLKVGGQYRIEIVEADADGPHRVAGKFKEIEPNRKLVFTWFWESKDGQHESLVTLNFIDQGEETELQLLHERLESNNSKNLHEQGWNGCLNRLRQAI